MAEVGGECAPRLENGDCGSIRAALPYERMVELAGLDALRGYADSRGFGLLADGTLMHFPVPGIVLEQYGLTEYTCGGSEARGAPSFALFNGGTIPTLSSCAHTQPGHRTVPPTVRASGFVAPVPPERYGSACGEESSDPRGRVVRTSNTPDGSADTVTVPTSAVTRTKAPTSA